MSNMPDGFGGRVKARRNDLRLTLDEVGARIGVTNQAVQKWESGKALPSAERLQPLAAALQTSVAYLLTGAKAQMPADEASDLIADVGRRLRRTRLSLGQDQQQFDTRAGLSQPQYNQFENGKRLLTVHAALKLCDEYGLTLDWLYRGDLNGLPYRLATALRDMRE